MPWHIDVFALLAVRVVMFATALALLPATVLAQACLPVWTNSFNGPGNGHDYPYAIAVDASNGNVYVTGYAYLSGTSSVSDYVTIGYSSAGVPLWTNFYNWSGNSLNRARAIAVDARNGDVVVTGDSGTNGSSVSTVATIKYSRDGLPLWTNRSYTSAGYAVTVDGSGNVLVTGTHGYGNATIKYSSAGAVLWAKTTGAKKLAVDSKGDVIIHFTSGSGVSSDYATYKYSSAGTLLWSRSYNGPNTQDQAGGVAVDASDNVYVTGESGDVVLATLKYSSAGVPVWTNLQETYGRDGMPSMSVGCHGDVYVTGVAPTTVKYSGDGAFLWTGSHDDMGESAGMALDGSGNVYVAASAIYASGPLYQCNVIARSSAGIPIWTNVYRGPVNESAQARAIATDASGAVYVAGFATGLMGNMDFTLVKYVTPPILIGPPLSRTNNPGTPSNFTVEAVGGTPLSYQWRRYGTNLLNGPNLSGVTTTNLTIANVQPGDAGPYTVVVTNAYGTTTSTVAQLTVIIPTSPGRFTNFTYSPVNGFSFVFRDATVGKPYRIQTSTSLAPSSWSDWISFNYSGPLALTDMSAVEATNRFYRAISP